MAQKDTDFTYIFGEKEDLLLVLFQGKMTARCEPQLVECEEALKTKSHKIVIFVFRDVSHFQSGPHVIFARMQKTLREEGKHIAVCSFRPEIKEIMTNLGIVRDSELYNNIPEAWNTLREKISERPQP